MAVRPGIVKRPKAQDNHVGIARSLIFLGTAKTAVPATAEEGRRLLEQGLREAHELGDGWGEGFGLFTLALAELDAGERQTAADRLRRAIAIEALGPVRAGGLTGLSQLASNDDPARAIRLVGAAVRMRERLAGQAPPQVLHRQEAIRAQAEQRMNPSAARQAWQDGYEMTTAEAIAYALQ